MTHLTGTAWIIAACFAATCIADDAVSRGVTAVSRAIATLGQCQWEYSWTDKGMWQKGAVALTADGQFFRLLTDGYHLERTHDLQDNWDVFFDVKKNRPIRLVRAAAGGNPSPFNVYDTRELMGLAVRTRSENLAELCKKFPTVLVALASDASKVTFAIEIAAVNRLPKARHEYTVSLDGAGRILRYRYVLEGIQGTDFFENLEFGEVQGVWHPKRSRMGSTGTRKGSWATNIEITNFKIDGVKVDLTVPQKLRNNPDVTFEDRRANNARLSRADLAKRKDAIAQGVHAAKVEFDRVSKLSSDAVGLKVSNPNGVPWVVVGGISLAAILLALSIWLRWSMGVGVMQQ